MKGHTVVVCARYLTRNFFPLRTSAFQFHGGASYSSIRILYRTKMMCGTTYANCSTDAGLGDQLFRSLDFSALQKQSWTRVTSYPA